jgi:hypothetical protein
MDFVKQVLSDKGGEFIRQLTGQLGFSAEQAESFVPAAIQKVLGLAQSGNLDVAGLLGGLNLAEVISKVDTQGLASTAGIDQATATRGLESLLPGLVSALKEKAGDAGSLMSLLGEEGAGGLVGAAGKLAGKLFK